MLAGATIAAGGMFWFSRLTVHSDYVGGLLGPMLVTSIGSACCSYRCPSWR